MTRSGDPPNRSNGESSTGKRKTSEASGEDGDDSARVSSEHDLKRTSSSSGYTTAVFVLFLIAKSGYESNQRIYEWY